MTRARTRGWMVAMAMSAAVSGCSGTPSPTAPATAATVTSIAVTSPGTGGASFQLTAMARMSDNTVMDVTQIAVWDSSNTSFATVSSAGLVTVRASGEMDLRATYRNVSGSVHAVVVRITAVGVTLSGISDFDRAFQLTATARLSDGNNVDVTNVATWESSDPSKATVSPTGLVRVVSDGDVEIRVAYQGMTDAWHLSRGSITAYYTLSGVVVGTDGTPISGADVRVLESSVSGNPTVSGAGGSFSFAVIEAGRHLLEVSKAGYQLSEVQFTLIDRNLQISLILRRIGE